MVRLASLPENYFNNSKFKKKFVDSNNKEIGNICVRHFKGSYEPYKIYTLIKCELYLPDECKHSSSYNYSFSIDYNENMSLDEFEIEYDKITRKWTKIIEIILNDVEIL